VLFKHYLWFALISGGFSLGEVDAKNADRLLDSRRTAHFWATHAGAIDTKADIQCLIKSASSLRLNYQLKYVSAEIF
jgi:hypothetical protein